MDALLPLSGRRHSREPAKAITACNDYLRLGPGRSLAKLHALYVERREREGKASVPTARDRTLEAWSSRYGWQRRAEAYDAEMEALKTARAHEILNSGLALPHERVLKLKALFEQLEAELTEGALWVERTKGIGSGETFERVSERLYNSALVSDLRGLLEDLAEETGGRQQRVSVGVNGLAGLLSQASNWEDAGWEAAD